MPATFNIPLVTPVDGDTITADVISDEWQNIYDNFTPAGVDDYSATTPEMQTTTDPYPASVVSRPTSLQGEIERLRYQINQIIGKSYWYEDPSSTLEDQIPSGTKMVFFQAAAPTGWTIDGTHNGKALRVVSSNGGGSGGSADIASAITLAHAHTVNSHTHDLGNHTHLVAAHSHTLESAGSQSNRSGTHIVGDLNTDPGGALVASTSGGAATYTQRTATTTTNSAAQSGAPSSNTSGAASPATDSQLSNVSLAYIDVIVCTKD